MQGREKNKKEPPGNLPRWLDNAKYEGGIMAMKSIDRFPVTREFDLCVFSSTYN